MPISLYYYLLNLFLKGKSSMFCLFVVINPDHALQYTDIIALWKWKPYWKVERTIQLKGLLALAYLTDASNVSIPVPPPTQRYQRKRRSKSPCNIATGTIPSIRFMV